MDSAPSRVSIVIATRDRRDELLGTLDRLRGLPERPPVIVVDNGSSDGQPAAVRRVHPDVRVIELGRNRGATARNIGVEAATTPYVAFADDDSWWAPGALARAAAAFDAHPTLAVLAARILVGDDGRLDPVCAEMAHSPLDARPAAGDLDLPGGGLPGPRVLGFVACGAVVRRHAFLAVGGFSEVVFFMGEEEMVALDLARAGWHLAYVPDVVAHHHPSSQRVPDHRRALVARNRLLTTWMRRPLPVAVAVTADVVRRASRDRVHRVALRGAAARLPAALARRRALPSWLENDVRRLEATA